MNVEELLVCWRKRWRRVPLCRLPAAKRVVDVDRCRDIVDEVLQ